MENEKQTVKIGDLVTRDGRNPSETVLAVYPITMALGEKFIYDGRECQSIILHKARKEDWYIYNPEIAQQLKALDAQVEAIRNKTKPLIAQLKRCE